MASNATLTIKVGANVKDAAQQLQALGYNIETVKKKTDTANNSASVWSQTLKKGSEDNIRKLVEMGAKFLTVSTVISGAYKGVSELVTEGMKVNQEASAQIDKINSAWTEVKQNLGSALLDTVSPALQTLYDKLEKIRTWSEKVAEEKQTMGKISDFYESFHSGTIDYDSYSIEDLRYWKSALEETLTDYADWGKKITKQEQERYDTTIAQLEKEIELRKQANKLTAEGETQTSKLNDALSFITEHSSLTVSYSKNNQIAEYQSIINEAETLMTSLWDEEFWSQWSDTFDISREKYSDYLEEIINTTKEKLSELTKEAKTSAKEVEKAVSIDNLQTNTIALSDLLKTYSTSYNNDQKVTELRTTLDNLKGAKRTAADGDIQYYTDAIDNVQSQIDSLTEQAEEVKATWADAFGDIYASGKNCFSSLLTFMGAYYDNQISRIENSEMAEEEKNSKINELEKKKFMAEQINSYSSAAMDFAEGMINIWSSYATNPAIAGTLTALLAANTGLHFATISQQTYTPSLAEGGIVTSPTHAFIGEGAEHEAVIPLSKLEDFVNRDSEGGAIYLNITCNGNSSEADVFRAIERAQRTGLLPHWRYA